MMQESCGVVSQVKVTWRAGVMFTEGAVAVEMLLYCLVNCAWACKRLKWFL